MAEQDNTTRSKPATDGACLTIFTDDKRPLNKAFELDGGAIRKTTRATFVTGTARTVRAPTAEALSGLLSGLTRKQAVCTGSLPDGVPGRVTTANKADGIKAIARTKDYLRHDAGPGWWLWDYDDKTMPEDVRRRMAAMGGPLAALRFLWPAIEGAEMLVVQSSSAGITAPGLPTMQSAGLHGYVLVQDVSRSKDIAEALQARAWAAGLAWFTLSASGAVLERSIIDVAVASPERLIFEAAPDLGEGLTRQSLPHIVQSGRALPCPTKPATAEARRDAARLAIKPQSEKVQRTRTAEYAENFKARTGCSDDEARRVARRRLVGRVLHDDDVIYGPGGSRMTVAALLEQRPHGRGMPDPDEGPEYGTTTATFLWDDGFTEPCLISHAHGVRRRFRFARFMDDDALQAAERTAEAVELPQTADLPDGRKTTLQAALQAAGDDTRLAVAVAVAHRLAYRVPHRLSVADVMAFIMAYLPGKGLAKDEQAAIEARVQWIVSKRKSEVMARCSLPGKARQRHDVCLVHDLAGVQPMPSGVTIIKAPPGAGKTQHVAAPFIAEMRAQGSSVMAVCHRVTLTAELARRLGLPDYQTARVDQVMKAAGVATCLPSIASPVLREALPKPDVLFIDEIAQVLDFLPSKLCAAGGYGNEGIHDLLREMIRDARAVVLADANVNGRVLAFIEQCRPGEQFRVFEMQAQARRKRAQVADNADAVTGAIAVELAAGGRVWLACEGKDKARAIAARFGDEGYRVMCVTAETKTAPDVAAFLADADANSLAFDLVVSSPAISSGLSIEHRETGPHFTLGGYIGSGVRITPEDAMQQLGRVRYLERFAIALEQHNLHGGIEAGEIKRGTMDLRRTAGEDAAWSGFDEFCALVQAERLNASAEFAAGLWWLLVADGWTLEHDARTDAGEMRALMKAARQATAVELVAAEPLDDEAADLLRRKRDKTGDDYIRLEAHRIRSEFGAVTAELVVLWDGGAWIARRERFEDMTGREVSRHDVKRRARVRLYAELFEGMDPLGTLTDDDAGLILTRIMRRPATYAAAGIVGEKYLRGAKMKYPKQAGREVCAVLERVGLDVEKRRVRVPTICPKTRFPSKYKGEFWDKTRGYTYAAKQACVDHFRDLERGLPEQPDPVPIKAADPPGQDTVTAADFAWTRAERIAGRATKARQARAVPDPARTYGTGTYGPRPSPRPSPIPRKRLVILPETERIPWPDMAPVSFYAVSQTGVRLVWQAAQAARIKEAFDRYGTMTATDPEAWT